MVPVASSLARSYSGVFSAALGSVQSVPRSELCAVIMLCRLVAAGATIHFYIDNKVAAVGIQHRTKGDSEDLWIAP